MSDSLEIDAMAHVDRVRPVEFPSSTVSVKDWGAMDSQRIAQTAIENAELRDLRAQLDENRQDRERLTDRIDSAIELCGDLVERLQDQSPVAASALSLVKSVLEVAP